MAAQSGTANLDVTDAWLQQRLERDACQFEFFQALRLIERLYPMRSPVGRYVRPGDEVVRFSAHTAWSFPASQIQQLMWKGSGPPVMVVNFMGLTGPMGVLPLYYTELVMHRVRAKDSSLRDFLDIFNHRMISLFYQAWEKYRFTVAYERGERDRFSHHLLDLIGLGTIGLQDRQAIPDDSLLFYTGLLSLHPRSASALRNILMDYFNVPVQVEQFVGAWYPLEQDDQCCFDRGQMYSEQVSTGAVVGDEIWDQASAVRVSLGPLTLRQYLDFLPNGSAYEPLRALTKFYSGASMDFEIQLVLRHDEVPFCELGASGDESALLGWTSWGKTKPMTRDPGDCNLRF